MADLFPALALGDCLDEAQAKIFNMKVGVAVTKGQAVKPHTHTAGELCSVQPAGLGDKALGVALKSGGVGTSIPVLVSGIVKVTASGAITMGAPVKSGAAGVVVAAVNTVTIPSGATAVTSDVAQPSMTVESGIAFGIALQTFADTDTGLILL